MPESVVHLRKIEEDVWRDAAACLNGRLKGISALYSVNDFTRGMINIEIEIYGLYVVIFSKVLNQAAKSLKKISLSSLNSTICLAFL